jgi:PmbA protein
LEKALSYSKNRKIDECEVVHVKKKVTTVRITDSEIYEIKQNFDEGYGIRLIHKKRILAAQTNNEQEIEKTIDDALKAMSYVKKISFWKSLPSKLEKNLSLNGTYDKKLSDMAGSNATDIAQEMINSALNSKIYTISGSLNIVAEKIEILNSNGLATSDKATYISGIINADSEHGQSQVSGIGQASCRTLDKFPAQQIGIDAKKMCVESINPKKCRDDTYSIIFEPYSVGELLAFVFTSNFNFKTFSEKKSCFSNNLGDEISVKDFNLVDDPHIPQGLGTKKIDDEGIKTSVNNLIIDGVFKNTFSNLFDSYKEGRETTGNAARPGSPMGRSSDPIPISTPHNLHIKSGSTSQDDMIKDTRRGLLVGRLWYTYAVNPIKGDFSCTARSGIRIIENGEIKSPGKPVRIIHNLQVLLQNITSVGDNEKNILPWASLPTITPSIHVQNIRAIPI